MGASGNLVIFDLGSDFCLEAGEAVVWYVPGECTHEDVKGGRGLVRPPRPYS